MFYKQTPPQVLEWRKNGRRWRKERAEFREIIDIGKEVMYILYIYI